MSEQNVISLPQPPHQLTSSMRNIGLRFRSFAPRSAVVSISSSSVRLIPIHSHSDSTSSSWYASADTNIPLSLLVNVSSSPATLAKVEGFSGTGALFASAAPSSQEWRIMEACKRYLKRLLFVIPHLTRKLALPFRYRHPTLRTLVEDAVQRVITSCGVKTKQHEP